ncbi:MAG: hypothetical protein LC676_02860 [Loktanella sp.]|nr:hypothetical protein [Loktanella sp.]
MIQLHGNWSLADAEGDHACTLTLPGDGITALHAAGLIPDPYWGRNEYDLRWICERDWVARRTFDLKDPAVELVLDRVDTIATVRVNGQVVLTPRNAFRSYRVALADVARAGENEIEITFHSPVAEGKRLFEAHPFPIPWSKNCPIPYGNFLRKPACDFGWDWNIALAPFGVYGDARIEAAAAPRIDSVLVHQDHADGVTPRQLFRGLRRTWPAGLAGLHVRLQPLPVRQRLSGRSPRRGPRERPAHPTPRLPCPVVRRQRTGRRADLV